MFRRNNHHLEWQSLLRELIWLRIFSPMSTHQRFLLPCNVLLPTFHVTPSLKLVLFWEIFVLFLIQQYNEHIQHWARLPWVCQFCQSIPSFLRLQPTNFRSAKFTVKYHVDHATGVDHWWCCAKNILFFQPKLCHQNPDGQHNLTDYKLENSFWTGICCRVVFSSTFSSFGNHLLLTLTGLAVLLEEQWTNE